jgi:hypothetical protein
MRRKHHIRLLILATTVWAGFLLGGMPDYYQQYSGEFMLGIDLLVLLPISVVLYLVLRRVAPPRRMSAALWIALYFTVPLAVYDWVYCGIVLGHGIRFLWEYWYLSVYYLIPWFLAPAIVLLVNRKEGRQPLDGGAA